MRRLFVLLTAAWAALLPTACSKSDSDAPRPLPAKVTIEEVTPARQAVSFTLKSEQAARVAYCCLSQGTAPDASAWTQLESPAASVTLRVEGLDAGTAYTLMARAENAKGEPCEAVSRDFETLRLPALQFGEVTATAEGAEASVTTSDALRLFWACLPADGGEPSEFTEVEAAAEMKLEIRGLAAATD